MDRSRRVAESASAGDAARIRRTNIRSAILIFFIFADIYLIIYFTLRTRFECFRYKSIDLCVRAKIDILFGIRDTRSNNKILIRPDKRQKCKCAG